MRARSPKRFLGSGKRWRCCCDSTISFQRHPSGARVQRSTQPRQKTEPRPRGVYDSVRVRSILAAPRDDGLEFDLDSIRGEQIRDEADYNGVRVKITARLATAQVPLHVDVNFGDPIWPAPAEAVLPLLLGGALRLLGYPDHMVLAEKIVTALERGEQNTRWRDFTDIAAIARSRTVDGADLQEAIGVVARYRQVELEPLGPLLAHMPALAQRKWEVWRKKQRLEQSTPASFADLLATCLAFVEPVLAGSANQLQLNLSSQAWEEPTSASTERELEGSSSGGV